MPDTEVSSIGVKLTLDATQFNTGIDAAKRKLGGLTGDEIKPGSDGGRAFDGGRANANAFTKITAEFNSAQVSRALRAATGNLSVPVSITPKNVSSFAKQIAAGVGTIPVSITPKFAESGRFSLSNVMGSVMSMQYGISKTKGVQVFKEAVERGLGPMPKGMWTGGPVRAETGVVVGEKGPELFVPRTSGHIERDIARYRQRESELAAIQGRIYRHMGGPAHMSQGGMMKGAGYVPGLRDLAQRYNREAGFPPLQRHMLHPLNPDFSRRTAAVYESLATDPDELSRRAYAQFAKETADQYAFLTGQGFIFPPSLKDPYSPSAGDRRTKMQVAASDVIKNRRLLAYASSLEHPLLTNEQNLAFRHVHDMFGHLAEGYSVGPRGEYNAAVKHSQMFSPLARMAMLAETHGQNSVVNFSPTVLPGYGGKSIAEVNKERPGTIYADQKARVLPQSILDEFYALTGIRRHRGGPVHAMAGQAVRTAYPFAGLGGPEMVNMERAMEMTGPAFNTVSAGIEKMPSIDRERSNFWYKIMKNLLTGISSTRDITSNHLAALVAKFSQNSPWPGNVVSAVNFHDQLRTSGAKNLQELLSFINPKNKLMKGVFATPQARKEALKLYSLQNGLWLPTENVDPFSILTGDKDLPFAKALTGNEEASAIDRFVNFSFGHTRVRATDTERAAGDMAIRRLAKESNASVSPTQAAAWYVGGGGTKETQSAWERLKKISGLSENSSAWLDTRLYHRAVGGPVGTGAQSLGIVHMMKQWAADPMMAMMMWESLQGKRRHRADGGDVNAENNYPLVHFDSKQPIPKNAKAFYKIVLDRRKFKNSFDLPHFQEWHDNLNSVIDHLANLREWNNGKSVGKFEGYWAPSEFAGFKIDADRLMGDKRAQGGPADPFKGMYIVGEIGPELFVPNRMRHIVPKWVEDQIPHAANGVQVIGRKRNELFAPPEDGIIIPNRLMDKVPHAEQGAETNYRNYAPKTAEELLEQSKHFDPSTQRYRGPGGRFVSRETMERGARNMADMIAKQRADELLALQSQFYQYQRVQSSNNFRSSAVSISGGLELTTEDIKNLSKSSRYTPTLDERLAQIRVQGAAMGSPMGARTSRGMVAKLASWWGGGGQEQAQNQAALSISIGRYNKVMAETKPIMDASREKIVEYSKAFTPAQRQTDAYKQSISGLVRTYQEARSRQVEAAKDVEASFNKATPSTGNIVKNLGSIIASTSAYGLAMQAANAVLQPAIDGIVLGAQRLGDQMLGFSATNTRVSSELGTQVKQNNGNVGAAMSQAGINAGLSGDLFKTLSAILGLNASAIASAKTAVNQQDMIRAAIGQRGAPMGLYGGYGGLFGSAFLGEQLGGGKGFTESMSSAWGDIQSNLNNNKFVATYKAPSAKTPSSAENLYLSGYGSNNSQSYLGATGGGLNGYAPSQSEIAAANEQIAKDTKLSSEWVSSQTAAAKRGAEAMGSSSKNVQFFENATEEDRKQAEAIARAAGDTNMAQAAQKGLIMKVNGHIAQTVEEYQKAVEQWSTGTNMASPEVWAGLQTRQIAAQLQMSAMQAGRASSLQIPWQMTQELLTNPLQRPGAGVVPGAVSGKPNVGALGVSSSVASGIKSMLSDSANYQKQLTELAQQGFDEQIKNIRENIPGNTPTVRDSGYGAIYGPQETEFRNLYASASAASANIAKLTANMNKLNVAAAQASWANQIRLANRAVQDALGAIRGYTGKGAAGSEFGRIQGQQQYLQFQLQQRQIATSIALAGFQAPGETGEERYARQKEAMYEAQIQQKQLTMSQREYSLSLSRAAVDTSAAVGVMQKARDAEINALVSQQTIADAEKKVGLSLQRIATITGQADTNWQTMTSAALTGISQFAGGLKDGLKAIYESLGYRVTTNPRTGVTSYIYQGGAIPGMNPPSSGDRGTREHAAGYLGNVSGATQMIVGEAGTETVAVLRNPRTMSLGATEMPSGGGATSVTVNINGATVRSDNDLNVLANTVANIVEQKLSRRGALTGLRQAAY